MAEIQDTHDGAKVAGEQVTDFLKNTYATAAKGTADFNLKFIEIARSNTNAVFAYVAELMGAKSMPEFVALSSTYARKQFETMIAQTKEVGELAQKVTTDVTQPLNAGVAKAFNNKGA